MKKLFATFFRNYTFRRQLGVTITLGIFMLALFSSVAGSWLGNERVRNNLLEQGRSITLNLARQSALALLYASSDNAAEAAQATLAFPGVVGLEIRDVRQRVLLKRGDAQPGEFKAQPEHGAADGKTAAVLYAESADAWRFDAPVYSQPANTPFDDAAAPELLGHVSVVVSKAEQTRMRNSIFAANMGASFSFALLFLFLLRVLSNRVTQPLNRLSESMRRAEAGEAQVRAEITGSKDIADMAHAFNSMMAVLEVRAAEITQLNEELEHRVDVRTAQLEAANRELEAFSYSVSHDLRAPLRAIDGFTRILLEDYNDKLDDEGKRLLKIVDDNARRMGLLIDDILKFSRSGRVELSLSAIDMEKLAREVFDELLPAVAGSKPQLEIAPLPPAMGDRAMMHQVFANLIANAIKFSSTREAPRIRVAAAAKGNETVYSVQDNGVGFDMQHVGKLFGVFQRLHGMEEFEGTGIGLAIVKRIISRHGGRVWAEGKVGVGATIYFSLPQAGQFQREGA